MGRDYVQKQIFSDGSYAIIGNDQIFSMKRDSTKNGKYFVSTKDFPFNYFLKKYRKTPRSKSGFLGTPIWSLPSYSKLAFSHVVDNLVIDPYILGVLLGDGCFTQKTILLATADPEIVSEINIRLPNNYKVVYANGYTYRVVGLRGNKSILWSNIKDMGLRGVYGHQKFIPNDYIFNSPEVRLQILQGLLDSDGCADKCSAAFSSSSISLAAGVQWIVRSLGGRASRIARRETSYKDSMGFTKVCKPGYRVRVSLPDDRLFLLDRKQTRIKGKPFNRSFIGAENLGNLPYYLISTNNQGYFFNDSFVPIPLTTKR